MQRVTRLVSILIVVVAAVAADEPGKAAKTSAPQPNAKAKGPAPGRATAAAGSARPKAIVDPRATSLFRAAQNLEKTGKAPGAIGLYRDLLIRYPDSSEASEATARLKALGGKIPTPAEIKPAPPPQEAKFTRVAKPKYASQEANRAAMNQALGGMMNSAATPPAAGGPGGYSNRAPYAP